MIAWAAVDPATGELREEQGDEVLPAASTIKLFVASAFWRSELDPGEVVAADDVPRTGESFAEVFQAPLTLADHALLMLAVSDNASTNLLLDRLGLDAVNTEIGRLGLERTTVRRRMLAEGPENLTCASDLARGLAALADDPRVLAPLALSQHSAVPALLGPDVRVYSKSGELPSVRHEAALLEAGGRRLAVTVCSSPPELPGALAELISSSWSSWS